MNEAIHAFGRASLKVGCIYFLVTFVDAEMTVPVVQTLRYLEKKEASGQGVVALFNELSAEDEPLFFVREEDVAHMVLDEQQLISTLERSFYRS
ncbi:hypothetical protein K4L06_00600 [Lysobacter sp. BMK333-48F3]|uniref:hypothetical protein n=1 Tax=Lysobacter sp. BMK333-48F3 TaxID=2867962 RepID=UPI001C8C9398|nr:hypothetical protein [Lysobacter sp. BMK333-48F3]MBX9399791.1 hypothetical protein [Lysobacter sp. BMK333-48F3]